MYILFDVFFTDQGLFPYTLDYESVQVTYKKTF